MNNAPRGDIVAELDTLVTSADLQRAWEAERNWKTLPNVVFTAEGRRVMMHFESEEGSLPDIQEIKRYFARAMHRKGAFPMCKIHWLT